MLGDVKGCLGGCAAAHPGAAASGRALPPSGGASGTAPPGMPLPRAPPLLSPEAVISGIASRPLFLARGQKRTNPAQTAFGIETAHGWKIGHSCTVF